jgi:hypothetical protein
VVASEYGAESGEWGRKVPDGDVERKKLAVLADGLLGGDGEGVVGTAQLGAGILQRLAGLLRVIR